MKVVSFVGKSGSGKTRLIESLIRLGKEEGLKIGAIKHAKFGFEIDKEGKDSFRFKMAGGDRIGIFSEEEKVVFLKEGVKLQRFIFESFFTCDLVLVEGFKEDKDLNKILVIGSPEDLKDFDISSIIGIYSDEKYELNLEKPYFSSKDLRELWEFIRNFPDREIVLYVNGEMVPLNPFLQDMFFSLILGMVKPLKLPQKEVRTIEIKWKSS